MADPGSCHSAARAERSLRRAGASAPPAAAGAEAGIDRARNLHGGRTADRARRQTRPGPLPMGPPRAMGRCRTGYPTGAPVP